MICVVARSIFYDSKILWGRVDGLVSQQGLIYAASTSRVKLNADNLLRRPMSPPYYTLRYVKSAENQPKKDNSYDVVSSSPARRCIVQIWREPTLGTGSSQRYPYSAILCISDLSYSCGYMDMQEN